MDNNEPTTEVDSICPFEKIKQEGRKNYIDLMCRPMEGYWDEETLLYAISTLNENDLAELEQFGISPNSYQILEKEKTAYHSRFVLPFALYKKVKHLEKVETTRLGISDFSKLAVSLSDKEVECLSEQSISLDDYVVNQSRGEKIKSVILPRPYYDLILRTYSDKLFNEKSINEIPNREERFIEFQKY